MEYDFTECSQPHERSVFELLKTKSGSGNGFPVMTIPRKCPVHGPLPDDRQNGANEPISMNCCPVCGRMGHLVYSEIVRDEQ